MSSASTWQWDEARKSYYTFSSEEGAYIYQDGTRVRVNTRTGSISTSRSEPEIYQNRAVSRPRTQASSSSSQAASISSGQYTTTAYESDLANQYSNLSLSLSSNYIPSYTAPLHTYGESTPQRAYPSEPQSYVAGSSYSDPALAQAAPSSPVDYNALSPSTIVERIPTPYEHDRPTAGDPNGNRRTDVRVRGSPGRTEHLDPRYRIVQPENRRKFFKVGRVFRVLWPEMASGSGYETDVTTDERFGEKIHVKVRWFVVVRDAKESCTCLPIQTYGGKGVTKRGVNPKDHAALVPKGKEQQLISGEKLTRDPLHLVIEDRHTKLSSASRINFSKVYTVEHNVKVYSVGRVAPEDIDRLKNYFRRTFDKVEDDESPNGSSIIEEGADEDNEPNNEDEEEVEEDYDAE